MRKWTSIYTEYEQKKLDDDTKPERDRLCVCKNIYSSASKTVHVLAHKLPSYTYTQKLHLVSSHVMSIYSHESEFET